MSNALVVDANTLKQKITERVINAFTDLIPEAVFAQMVDETIKMFFEQPRAFNIKEDGYGSKSTISTPLTTFQVMVWEQLRPIVAEKVKEYFDAEKDALKKSIMPTFATDMKAPVTYNVACLTHALANASQTKLVQQAFDMMSASLSNIAYRMHMPELANVRTYIMPDDGLEVDSSSAIVKK